MHSNLPLIVALGTLGGLAAADNLYTYLGSGCSGASFLFKDIDHNICAVTITKANTSIKDAIAQGVTGVKSAKLEVQETGKKTFLGWDEGPDSNDDGLLQCGTVAVNKSVTKRETCIDAPDYLGNLHGFSWSEPGDNKKRDVLTCTGSRVPDSVVLVDGRAYKVKNIPAADYKKLVKLAMNGAKGDSLPKELSKYEDVRE